MKHVRPRRLGGPRRHAPEAARQACFSLHRAERPEAALRADAFHFQGVFQQLPMPPSTPQASNGRPSRR